MRYLLALVLTSGTAAAECYVKSSSISEMQEGIEKTDNVQRYPIRLNNDQFRCSVTFNAQIKGRWYPVESSAIGSGSEDLVCAQALNSGSARILEKVVGTKFTMQQEMVCTDQPLEPKKSVNVGDLVRESEVVPDPAWPRARRFRDGNECLRFVESDLAGSELRRSYGVICRVDQNSWRVVDKF
jgi:hypothetical protein